MKVNQYLIATEYISGIFSLLYIIFSIMTKAEYKLKEEDISLYKTNWNSAPIINIELSNEEGCKENFEPLISNKFPLLKKGCDCTNSNKIEYRGKIFEDLCNERQLEGNCLDVEERPESPFYKWKNSVLCVERGKKSFWDLMPWVTKSVSFCPNNYKSCGVFDSIGNILCLPEEETCPINYIKILGNDQPANEELQSLNKIKMNDKYTLYYSNNFPNNKIIVNLFANLNYFCINPNKGKFLMNKYPLNSLKGYDYCGKRKYERNEEDYFDPRFTILDNYSSNSFYEENNINKNIKNALQYPRPLKGSDIYLFYVNYLGWNANCYKEGRTEYTEDNMIDFEKRDNNTNTINYYILLAFLTFGLTIVTFALIVFIKTGDEKFGLIITLEAFKIIFCFLMIVIGCIFIQRNNKFLSSYNHFEEEKCGDNITEYAFDIFYKGISSKNKYFIITIILSGFEIILKFLFFVFICVFNEDLKRKTL